MDNWGLVLLSACLGIAAVASDALAAPVSAAAVWKPEATPVVPGVSGDLEGVACATDQTCFAVGSMLDAGGHPTAIAMKRTSAGWSTLPLVQPRAAWSDVAIACAGPRLCIAVGTVVPASWSSSWSRRALERLGLGDHADQRP